MIARLRRFSRILTVIAVLVLGMAVLIRVVASLLEALALLILVWLLSALVFPRIVARLVRRFREIIPALLSTLEEQIRSSGAAGDEKNRNRNA